MIRNRATDTRSLSDVATTVPVDGQTLVWNDTAGEYQPADVAASPHALGGAEHTADTLANLNGKVSDATLDDSSDTRDPNAHSTSHENGGADELNVAGLSGELADPQPPKAHSLGGAEHTADTLANLNAKVSDATLDDSGDSRDPKAHASSHEPGGADAMAVDAAAATGSLRTLGSGSQQAAAGDHSHGGTSSVSWSRPFLTMGA